MPYAPAVQDRGADYLFQGISSAGNALGRTLDYLSQRREAEQDEDKQRARKFKALVDYADTTGIMSKDKAMTMSVDSLEGAVQGYAAKQKFDADALRLKQAQQADADRAALINFARDYATGDRGAVANALAQFGTAAAQGNLGALPDSVGAFTDATAPANRLNFALAQNPAAFASPQFDNSLSALQRYGGATGEPLQTQDVPGTDMTAVWTGKNGPQLVYKRGSNDAGLVPQHDEDGNLMGWSMTDPRGHARFYPFKGDEKVRAATDDNGNVIPGYYITREGKTMNTQTLMEKNGFTVKRKDDGTWTLEPMQRPESGKANEVIRFTKDGKRAVFDANTKKFIRYAN